MAAPQSGAVEERGLFEFLIRQRACPDALIRRTNCHVPIRPVSRRRAVAVHALGLCHWHPSCRASCFGTSSYPYRHFRAVRRRDRCSGLGRCLDDRRLQQRGRDRRTTLASRVLTDRSGDECTRSRSAVRLARSSLAATARSQRSTGRAPAVLDPANAGLSDGEGRSCLRGRHAPRTVRRQWCPCSLGLPPERFAAPQRDRSGKTRRSGPRLPHGHHHCA